MAERATTIPISWPWTASRRSESFGSCGCRRTAETLDVKAVFGGLVSSGETAQLEARAQARYTRRDTWPMDKYSVDSSLDLARRAPELYYLRTSRTLNIQRFPLSWSLAKASELGRKRLDLIFPACCRGSLASSYTQPVPSIGSTRHSASSTQGPSNSSPQGMAAKRMAPAQQLSTPRCSSAHSQPPQELQPTGQQTSPDRSGLLPGGHWMSAGGHGSSPPVPG
eukprot:scaffold1833_cov255-Pinguiococcus_pyrenoidosus.AAC.1